VCDIVKYSVWICTCLAYRLCLVCNMCMCMHYLLYSRQWRREGVCRPGQTSVLPPPPIRLAIDILMVTTMTLVWSVTNITLSWGCNYVMQTSRRIRSAMWMPIRQKWPNFRIPYFRPSKCRPCTVPPGAHAPSRPPPAATDSRAVESV